MPIASRWKLRIPNCSLSTFLFDSPTAPLSSKAAYVDAQKPDSHVLSYHDFRLWCQRFAAGLIAAGLEPGDPVLLYSGNTLFFPVVVIGTIMAQGIFTGANPSYNAREVAYQLADSGAKFFLCAESSLEVGLEAAKEVNLPKHRIFTFDDGSATFDGKGAGSLGCRHWTSLLVSPEQGRHFCWRNDPAMVDDTVALNYSSGTTGLPKGVMITHRNYVSNAIQHMHLTTLRPKWESQREDTRWLAFLPMYHALAQTVFCGGALSLGVTVYIMAKFDFAKLLENVQNFRITDLTLVPPVVVAIAKSPLTKKYDLSSLVQAVSGAAPLGAEITREFNNLWPPGQMNLKQGWGMTEVTCSSLGWDQSKKSDSFGVGELNANNEAKIMDPATEREVTIPNARGELWIRAPNVMKGYWKKPEATRETLTPDGWLKTGDVVIRDRAGVFFIVDRMKELIKVKGNQVAPAELEAQLLEHPSIADAAVVGVTINGEERPRAYIVNQPGASVTPDDAAKFMQTKVSRAKHLTGGVKVVDAISKNPVRIRPFYLLIPFSLGDPHSFQNTASSDLASTQSGKILRRLYREQAAREVGDSSVKESRL